MDSQICKIITKKKVFSISMVGRTTYYYQPRTVHIKTPLQNSVSTSDMIKKPMYLKILQIKTVLKALVIIDWS